MTSYVDMSLEDIIRRKKKENIRTKGPLQGKVIKKPSTGTRIPITDARNKIISKKRNQITDAREKLAELAKQKDARLKLEQLRKKRAIPQPIRRNSFPIRGRPVRNANKEIVFGDPSRQVVSQPISHARSHMRRPLNTRFMESRTIGSTRSQDKIPKLQPIFRTVANDLEIIDDPMGEEFSPSKVSMFNRKANLQLKIVAHNNEVRSSRTSSGHRLTTPEKEKSPPRPPSILKKRPTMTSLRTEKKTEKVEKPALEYRIIVSNLRNTVTGGDIEELFGDVGGMVESRLVRPGTAEVIYKTVEDAQRAVELYHNRQLDGQPMNCLLVTPRASNPALPARNGSKPALYSTNSNVEPDISTFHKVMFNNF